MTLNRNVTVIPARARNRNGNKEEVKPKLRVAAYCRVSTDSEEQASSYDVQVKHYTSYIEGNAETNSRRSSSNLQTQDQIIVRWLMKYIA